MPEWLQQAHLSCFHVLSFWFQLCQSKLISQQCPGGCVRFAFVGRIVCIRAGVVALALESGVSSVER